jgi:hypothetical protein
VAVSLCDIAGIHSCIDDVACENVPPVFYTKKLLGRNLPPSFPFGIKDGKNFIEKYV